MTRRQWLLVKLMEECDETSQRASKSAIFGGDEIEPKEGETRTNDERILGEFCHIVAYLEILKTEGFLPWNTDMMTYEIEKKRQEIEKWYQHSIDQGQIKE